MTTNYRTLQSESSNNVLSINEAVNLIGTGKFQKRILFASGTCFIADSMEIMLLSFLSLLIKRDWDLGDNADFKVDSITSVMFVGSLVGTACLGPLGDRVGRKPVCLIAAFIISFFGVATAFCSNISQLLFVRFSVGIGIGGLTVPFDILAELVPTEIRGRYLLLIEYFWTAGSILVPVLAYLTLELSWRLFIILCAVPCFISLIVTHRFVPESPRWLVCKGRNEEALHILRNAARVNGKDPNILFPEGCTISMDEEEGTSNVCDLFQPRWRRVTLLLFVVWVGFAFSYYGVIMTVTKIFGNVDEKNEEGNEQSFDYGAILISSSAEIMGTAIVIFLVDRIGRIPTQVSAYCTGGIAVFLLCYFVNELSRSMLITLAFIGRVAEMSGSCVTWISTAEIYPTEIRSTGHSATNAVARLGGFMMPYILSGVASLQSVGFIMLFIHICTALSASYLPETKGLELGHAPLPAEDTSRKSTGSDNSTVHELADGLEML